mmetsp:Transcript_25026/g.60694  ORF Transcript_25026/g.60694 Transcript_25026/m.60694 type:complete len:220 (-) Transcript_25026:260-919(-)
MSACVKLDPDADSSCGRPGGGTDAAPGASSFPSPVSLHPSSRIEHQVDRLLATGGGSDCEGRECAGAEAKSCTTVVVGRLTRATSWSLLRIVAGDRADELCDYSFVPQDRRSDGSLRNFRFGFVNFKEPGVAARYLSEGLERRRYTVREAGIQGRELNIAKFWDKVEQRGMTMDFSRGCRPIVQTESGWEPIAVPERFKAHVQEENTEASDVQDVNVDV